MSEYIQTVGIYVRVHSSSMPARFHGMTTRAEWLHVFKCGAPAFRPWDDVIEFAQGIVSGTNQQFAVLEGAHPIGIGTAIVIMLEDQVATFTSQAFTINGAT